MRRLSAAVLLLALFFLPLHFHSPTLTPTVSKECSCVHGSRAQLGLAAAPSEWAPLFEPSPLVVNEPLFFGWLSIESVSIRAPPSIISL